MKKIRLLAALLVLLTVSITGMTNQSQDSLIKEIDSLKHELEKVNLELERSNKIAQKNEMMSVYHEHKFERAKIINLSIIVFSSVLLLVLIIFIYKFYRFKKLRAIAKDE